MRTSLAAFALFRRATPGGRIEYLAQWNERWHAFHFIGGHQPPSPIGGNGPDRFAHMTPEEILEEIRQERWRIESAWADGREPGHAAPENHAAVTKPG
jgi:hypothetical protein